MFKKVFVKRLLAVALFAIANVFALTLASCDRIREAAGKVSTIVDSARGGGDSGDDEDDGSKKLTVTGIPSKYNGKYAYFATVDEAEADEMEVDETELIYGIGSVTETGPQLARISKGKVTLSLYAAVSETQFERYYGNDDMGVSVLVIQDSETGGGDDDWIATCTWLYISYLYGGYTTTWSSGTSEER